MSRDSAQAIVALLVLAAAVTASGQVPYEGYYLFLNDYPRNANPGWHVEAQGLAHDENNWFITQQKAIWKIPVSRDIWSPAGPGTSVVDIDSLEALNLPTDDDNYNHFGDADYIKMDGQGLLFVPVEHKHREGDLPVIPVIAVFRVSDSGLFPLAWQRLAAPNGLQWQTSAGWCALGPNKEANAPRLYSSNSTLERLREYEVIWGKLLNESQLVLKPMNEITLFDPIIRDGKKVEVMIDTMQGGEFSPTGDLLYISAGYSAGEDSSWGIHVFDWTSGLRIQRSSREDRPFLFEFHPGWSEYQEPEGLTVWDLDGKGAPAPGLNGDPPNQLHGQLHVLLLENCDPDFGCTDDVYMKHYTSKIRVNGAYTCSCPSYCPACGDEAMYDCNILSAPCCSPSCCRECGTFDEPLSTVGDAIKLTNSRPLPWNAWDGAEINIEAGFYPLAESLTLSRRVRLTSHNGTAVIGR